MSTGPETATPSPSSSPRITSADQARRAMRLLRRQVVRNALADLLRGSRLRLSMILFCSAVFWVGLFGLFYGGFEFLASYVSLQGELVEYVFSMFFLSLLIMLVFSTGIILYTGLYQSKEATFLLTTPISTDRIFAYKFAEAIAFSSWAFILLGSPLLVAYGIMVGADWRFHCGFLLFLLSFVLIPGSIGSLLAVLVARFMPRRQKTILGIAGTALVVGGIALTVRAIQTPGDPLSANWLGGLFSKLAFSQHPLWPSRWMSAGLVAAAAGDWDRGLFYLMVIASHAGVLYLLAAVVARDLYREGYSRVQGGRSSRKRVGWGRIDGAFHAIFGFLPRPIRLLILKDLRTFLRDPAQWSQFLIFFGLLAFYFINIRRLSYDVQKEYWRNLISFLNLAVTALILSTFTSRFIFPLLSLEGRNFWVLGLLPLKRESILWGKFAFASGISLVATEVLVLLSDTMLRIRPLMILLHMAMVAILCLGLSGISVGLGARLPDLKEDDPSKIAAGFGGTLNLLVSLAFIFAVVTALALPCHMYFAGLDSQGEFGGSILSAGQFRFWITVAIFVSLGVGVVGTVVPLRIGIKAFQRMEF